IVPKDLYDPDVNKKTGHNAFGISVTMSFANLWLPGLPNVLYVFYGHLSSITEGLKVGSRVTPYKLIGMTGKTGNATRATMPPHLHSGLQITKEGLTGTTDPRCLYGPPPLLSPVCRYAAPMPSTPQIERAIPSSAECLSHLNRLQYPVRTHRVHFED